MEMREQYLRLRNSRKKHNQDMEESERQESNRREETPFDDINEDILEVIEKKRVVTPLVSLQEEVEKPKHIIIPNVGNVSKLDKNFLQDKELEEKFENDLNTFDIQELEEWYKRFAYNISSLKTSITQEKDNERLRVLRNKVVLNQELLRKVEKQIIIKKHALNTLKNETTKKQKQSELHASTRNVSAIKKPEKLEKTQKPEKKKEVLFEIVIDGTLSFTKVYPKVFYILKNFLHIAQDVKKEYRGVVFQYGLTVFHEDNDVESINFGDKQYFTESETEVIEILSNLTFYGGSENGREDFTGALDQALRVLNNHGEKLSSRGILFFSDSIPDKDKLEPDFTEMIQDGYLNKGLRFAQFYTGTDDFCPKMLMVNGDGNLTGDAKNETSYECLENILKADPNQVSQELKEMVNNILNQTSILM